METAIVYWGCIGIMEKKMETTIVYWGYIGYMGSCQNYGPFLGTLNIRCRTIMGTPKETIILTTTQVSHAIYSCEASGTSLRPLDPTEGWA